MGAVMQIKSADGNEKSYELWETRFLVHIELHGHRKVIPEDRPIPMQEREALAQDELKKGRSIEKQEFVAGNARRKTRREKGPGDSPRALRRKRQAQCCEFIL